MSFDLLLLSDSHLFDSAEKELFEVNTYKALDKLTAGIREEGAKYDLMIVSGDISEDGSGVSYENFHRLTKGLALSAVWMNGNHDKFSNVPVNLRLKYLHKEWHLGPWSLIFLDTAIPGRDEGYLERRELERLRIFLHDHNAKQVMIFMHHQPADVGSEFIDQLGLQNKESFWKSAGSSQQLKAIIFGHVHQELDLYDHHVRLISNPSTAIQFKPLSRKLDFDSKAYCYRTLRLHEDGSMEALIHKILP